LGGGRAGRGRRPARGDDRRRDGQRVCQIRGGHIRAARHGKTTRGRSQSGAVVQAISHKRHDGTIGSERLHQRGLVTRQMTKGRLLGGVNRRPLR
jgi:hypothetical protein